jgi:hypothetical protein
VDGAGAWRALYLSSDDAMSVWSSMFGGKSRLVDLSAFLECPGKKKLSEVHPPSMGFRTHSKRSDITTFIQQVPDYITRRTQGLTTRPKGSVLSLKNVAVGFAARAALVELHAVLKLPTASILRLMMF